MTSPEVFILIPDCLRSADANLMTEVEEWSDVSTSDCYSSGTWTLPAHATLYSATPAYDHKAVRRGESLSENKVSVPKTAQENDYKTALVSENPTFGSGTGFDKRIDVIDEDIHLKKFPTTYSPAGSISDVSPQAALTLFSGVLKSDSILRNCINSIYGTYEHFRSKPPTEYPHHGERVLSHLSKHMADHDELFAMVNLLDTHNPHYTPPKRGARRLGLEVSPEESKVLANANQNLDYVLGEPLLENFRDRFESRDAVQSRMYDIYQAQIAHIDALISDWFEEHEERLDDSLVVIVGDHGQMFGAEGMVGHHTSLHPHGVSVPAFLSFPNHWSVENTDIQGPTSFIGLSQAIEKTLAGEITESSEFLDVWADAEVVISVDGPTWKIEKRQEEYEADLIDRLGVRKIGIIEQGVQTVHTCPWQSSKITTETYQIWATGREQTDATPADLSDVQRDWLISGDDSQEVDDVSVRLEALGYK
ncbi:sulfatase-like hydrolase/transferase [Halorubrum ezzemoulense]|uniref:sulfatase-like hydrolase/transferase n=1 Tax=Halorubrum ezzemoulense TaxID=337243 RepID=UPI00232DF308|nr:sulfatase-like hydrolase/transferase [Halorubrum ezzemoulense]MDB9250745.1 sulfatase-like hydrolase/transferase [Halorubrum ezzemoulense]MDB9260888.1 sulfatase-like hydrolase/transferase [Halorubrum ezzemoulense]MDB9264296.1 sulfatase-like hydrolase/transferase [Halorubrum ezzemoulense]MDB9267788.1 sulfatase-like hydrolase/transferase [Halorubrum ezzemoulense]MDB9271249.1 sulfatase-like hydrolase/transferase [Halorubrum ezzemoulense]